MKLLEQEEAEKKKELARKEAQVEEKLKAQHLIAERQLAKEARERDEERRLKIEEFKKKTELLIKAQEDLAEKNRLTMLEREERIMTQLEKKKEMKREEILLNREKATKRITEAIDKYRQIDEQKRIDFEIRQKEGIYSF